MRGHTSRKDTRNTWIHVLAARGWGGPTANKRRKRLCGICMNLNERATRKHVDLTYTHKGGLCCLKQIEILGKRYD